MPFPPRYLSCADNRTLLPYSSLSNSLLDLSIPPRVLTRLIPLGINPPFLYSANVFPIFLLRSTCARSQPLSPHLHAVMYPLLVFPALSSALIPTLLFPRTFSSIFPPLKSMPVCSRPFHHACSLPSFFPALQAILSIFLFGAPLPGNVPDFRCHCRFPSACASMRRTCVHLRINPSSLFSPITLPRLSSLPLSRRLFRHNRYPHAAVASCVTFLLAYVSISHRFSSHFLPTINTLSHSVYILLVTREVLNSDKIQQKFMYYILKRKNDVLSALKNVQLKRK